MPRLSGAFDIFTDLEQIPISDITRWLTRKGDLHNLQNTIGNRLIYPQTIPLTKEDIEIDLAILREAVFRQPDKIYNLKEQKLVIPEEFLQRFPPSIKLIISLIEALNPQGVTPINIRSATSPALNLVGSCVAPPYNGVLEPVDLIINEHKVAQINPGSLVLYPYKDRHLRVKIKNFEANSPGGELGLIVDLRKWV